MTRSVNIYTSSYCARPRLYYGANICGGGWRGAVDDLVCSIRGAGHICLNLNLNFQQNFPLGLHMILKLQIKKFKICLNDQMRKIISTENPLGCSLGPL